MKIVIRNIEKQSKEFDYPIGTKVEQILKDVKEYYKYPIYACKLDNAYRALTHICTHDSVIEFLDIRNQATWLIYQNSLILLFIKVLHDVCGLDSKISVRNSLNKGLYITTNKEIDDNTLMTIDKGMRELVKKDVPIIKRWDSQEDVKKLALDLGQKETYRIVDTMPSIQDLSVYSLEDEKQVFYSLMVPSTSYLKLFELRTYKRGLLIRFPHQKDPLSIQPFANEQYLYDAFKQTNGWGKITGIKYISDMNERAHENHEDLFLLQEALHNKRINELSEEIISRNARVVLICGPSSSGKTTFAKRLCIQLRVSGKDTLYLGTDDYFLNRNELKVDENGEMDFESISAVDVDLFRNNIVDLLNDKLVDIPTFNFIKGEKEYGKRKTRINKDTIIVIEGIHALNKILTKGIDDNEKYKIYISPFSPISLDRINRFPTTDSRMLRRLVRDYQFRGYSAKVTLKDWHKVRAGEDTNIFPFAKEADAFFNSNCIYEMGVLKKYAEPLLKTIGRDEAEYGEAQRMLGYLSFVETIEDDDLIVNNSIIREFIGGSAIVK